MPKKGSVIARSASQNVLTSSPAAEVRDAGRKAQEFLLRAVRGETIAPREVRGQVYARLWRIAADPNAPKGQQISALKLIDDITPPEPPERVDGEDPTPEDARRLILRYFGDDIVPRAPSAEVDGIVDAFPGSDVASPA